MRRPFIIETLGRINALSDEIESYVPAESPHLLGFRSDLAGLLNVLICATYENCVKMIIMDYTSRQNALFGSYAEVRYEKINSKINLNDLQGYADTFHPNIGKHFKERIKYTKSFYLRRSKRNIEESYTQILRWRHSFAHTGARVTTIEEVLDHHRVAKRVILIFADSFSVPL